MAGDLFFSICLRCGKRFPCDPGAHGRPRRYCSDSCRKAANNEKKRARARSERKEVSSFCVRCGKAFSYFPFNRLLAFARLYCSAECRVAAGKERLRKEKLAALGPKVMERRVCQCCGKPFVYDPHAQGKSNKRYCSDRCRMADQDARRKAEREIVREQVFTPWASDPWRDAPLPETVTANALLDAPPVPLG